MGYDSRGLNEEGYDSRGRYSVRESNKNQEYEYEKPRKQGRRLSSLVKFIVFGGIMASLIYVSLEIVPDGITTPTCSESGTDIFISGVGNYTVPENMVWMSAFEVDCAHNIGTASFICDANLNLRQAKFCCICCAEKIYVTDYWTSTISWVIDTTTNTVTQIAPLSYGAIAFTPDGQFALLGGEYGTAVFDVAASAVIINTSSVFGIADFNTRVIAITPDGKLAYAIGGLGHVVYVIGIPSGNIIANIPVGTNPTNIAITANGKFAYVTNSDADTVSVISILEINSVTTINGLNTPFGIAIMSDDAYAYVTNSGSNTVSVISLDTNTVLTSSIAVGGIPSSIAIDKNDAFAYVVNSDGIDDDDDRGDGSGGGSVSVISLNNNSVTATIAVGNFPRGIYITANSEFVYVSCIESSSVAVIRTSDNAVIQNISINGNPIISAGVCIDFIVRANV